MKKLGIAIKSTLQGSGEPVKINPGAWTDKVVDIRDVLRHVPSLATDPRHPVLFVSFSRSGCYITVARSVPGREGDNIAGWIYVPADIIISGEEIVSALENVKRLIFGAELPEPHTLDAMFGKAYPLRVGECAYRPSPKNGRFAFREVTAETPLPLLLGEYLYQPYYCEFQAVFLESERGRIVEAVDLSSKRLEKMCTVLPPTPDSLMRLGGEGTTVMFGNTDQPFRNPINVSLGSTIQLRLVRPGYEPFHYTFRVNADGQPCHLPRPDWQKKITPADFVVFSASGERIQPKDYRISVNGQPLNAERFMLEPELIDAKITVTLKSGEKTSVEANLNRLPVQVRFQGGPAGNENTWSVYLSDGSRGQVVVRGKHIRSTVSPLKGYEVQGSWLEFKSGNIWRERIIGFFGALVLGGLVCGILALCGAFRHDDGGKDSGERRDRETEVTTGNEGENPSDNVENPVSGKDISDAIAYLDNNDSWEKREMDKFKALEGLYADLNSFNFDNIINKWGPLLKGSKNFKDVLEDVKRSKREGYDVWYTKEDGFIEPSNTQIIKVLKYRLWVNHGADDQKKEDMKREKGNKATNNKTNSSSTGGSSPSGQGGSRNGERDEIG